MTPHLRSGAGELPKNRRHIDLLEDKYQSEKRAALTVIGLLVFMVVMAYWGQHGYPYN